MSVIKNIPKEHYIDRISYESTKNILDQMEKNVCVIKMDNLSAGGFFCKIPLHEKNNKVITALLTNNRFMNDNILNQKNKEIFISTIHEPSPKSIKLDNKERFIGRYKKFGIIIIEIKETDGIKNFFEIADGNDENNSNYINDKCIYMIHFEGEKLYVSFGSIKGTNTIKIGHFNHTCDCGKESLGSPIISLKSNKIIGIHTSNNEKTYNTGIPFNISRLTSSSKSNRYTEYYIKKSSTSDEIGYEYIMKNGLNISEKRGLCAFEDEQYSRLNSIIQMLTSIKEIGETINPNTIEEDSVNIIQKFNHIYPFTSFFHTAYFELYNLKKIGENPSLSKMNIFMKFVNKDISKQRLYNYFISILGFLHEELVNYPFVIPGKEPLISFNSPLSDLENSKNVFYQYYDNTYQKSIISNLFNWIRREARYCKGCKVTNYSYQSFPSLLLDLDDIDKFLTDNKMYLEGKEKKLDLQSCLNIYSLVEHINNNNKEFCSLSNEMVANRSNYFIDTSPPYFVIILNRTKEIHFSYKDEFELQKNDDSTYVYTKYKLRGVILKEAEKYSCVIKNSEYKNKEEGKIMEHWKKFSDDKVKSIKFEKRGNYFENQNDIFNPYNTRILLYKGESSVTDANEKMQ